MHFELSEEHRMLKDMTARFAQNEYAVEKLYRDAKVLELFEGTKEAEIMTICRTLQTGYQAR